MKQNKYNPSYLYLNSKGPNCLLLKHVTTIKRKTKLRARLGKVDIDACTRSLNLCSVWKAFSKNEIEHITNVLFVDILKE